MNFNDCNRFVGNICGTYFGLVYCVIKNKTINLHLSEKDVSLLTGNI